MPRKAIVKIFGAASGVITPHDGKYVVDWNPHTKAGVLEVTSTSDITKARRFESGQEFSEWKTVSNVEPKRWWDGGPNRPLSAITIESIFVEE